MKKLTKQERIEVIKRTMKMSIKELRYHNSMVDFYENSIKELADKLIKIENDNSVDWLKPDFSNLPF
jgi:hypothetical protein